MKEINKKIWETKYNNSGAVLGKGIKGYDKHMLDLKFNLIRKYGKGKVVLDLCCGTGEYLYSELPLFKRAVGIDFSEKMLSIFRNRFNKIPSKLKIMQGDAREIPLKNESVDFVYSYSSLYYVPEVERAIGEIGRVLKSGGFAAFELGNFWSANTFITELNYRVYGWSKPFHISYPKMLRAIDKAGLKIVDQHTFQFFPTWGIPLIPWGVIKKLISHEKNGKMIDERISSLGLLKYFSFRHIFICQKK